MTFTCMGQFSFDIADVSDSELDAEFRRRVSLFKKMRQEIEENVDDKSVDDFTVAELQEALRNKEVDPENWVEEVYQLVAEGRIDDALHAMRSEVPSLAPPSHARAVADLLSGARG